MGWIIFTLSITLVCAAGALVATSRAAAPPRHVRRHERRHEHRADRRAGGVRSLGLLSHDLHPSDVHSTGLTGAHARTGQHGRWHSTGRHAEGGGELSAMARHMHVLRRPLGQHRQDDDPFEVLTLQCRLTALAAEIQRLEQGSSSIALAHHLRATQYAYDVLLAEACRLIGVRAEAPPEPDEATGSWTVDEETRMHKELELTARGWTW